MANDLRFDGRVVIITGAGNGLGRSHALLFGARGARVVVNDLGGSAHGAGKSAAAADQVVQEIKAAGGEAVANHDSVEDGDKIVQCALSSFGRIDFLVNNAGILRDTSFQKMTDEDWDLIYRVHVRGAYKTTHAAWNHMRDAGYGRILFTASAAGIYGNFGQANYATAKLGLVGFSNTLAIEGRKKNVLCNAIAPVAGSRMTETVLPKELIDALRPEFVTPLVAYLCHESCKETGGLFEVGGGFVGKLRWERAKGHTFRLSRPISPEAIRDHFGEIAGFAETTHPADITSSMQPILTNLPTAKGRGGNELIDVDEALGYEFPEQSSSYDERDLSIYALGVGAAHDPSDAKDLPLVYELSGEGFRALPTFAVVPALNVIFKLAKEGRQAPGMHYGLDRVLHGEQYTEIKRPLPTHAKLTHKLRVKDIFDKGKNALVITAITTYDESGEELAYNELTTFVRGAGGWGGERGPSSDVNTPPDRAPDATITEKTRLDQALLYRLSGDWNPLHADPAFAQAFGFPRPILHGLCSYGFAARHVIRSFCDNDPRTFKSIKARFADSVFPGETLVTEMWKESDTRIVFRTKVLERDKVVISNAAVELYKEVPRQRAKAAVSAPAAVATSVSAAASGEAQAKAKGSADSKDAVSFQPTSADIFAVIADHIQRTQDIVARIGTTFVFKLTSPESIYTLDLKNGAGGVTPGAADKADVTLEIADADFMAMTSGKADAQKLYFGGKLKISGNVMASQKLTFLQKMDPEAAMRVIVARRGGASPTGPALATTPASSSTPAPAAAAKEARSPALFGALRDRLAKNPGLAAEVGGVLNVQVKSPDRGYVLDLRPGAANPVSEGQDPQAATTLTLAEEDLLSLCQDPSQAHDLFMHGKLRVDGDVRLATHLGFLKGLAQTPTVS